MSRFLALNKLNEVERQKIGKKSKKMKKVFLTLAAVLATKEMTEGAFLELSPEEQAKMSNEINANNAEYHKQQEEANASVEELTKITKEIAEETQKQVVLVIKTMNTLASKIAKQGTIEDGKPATIKSVVSEKFEAIKGLKLFSPGSDQEVEIKASVSTASVIDNQGAYDVAGVGQLATRTLAMESLFATTTVTGPNVNKTIRYYDWDEATIVRAADMVAECAQFPESTASWKRHSLDIQKVGDTLPVCEEFFEDESMFAGELEFFLRTNVALKVDDQLINGDGTGNNLKGLIASATTYVAAASGIPSPTIYDLIVKVKAAITATGGSKYMPNFVLMNNEDICAMDLSKDGNNNYIMPPFVSRDGETVKGLRVIEDNAIPANQLVVGDANYGRIYAAAGLTMSRGTIDKQFVEDAMTLKVRRRLALLIREADKTGFYHVADIDAALVTIGS
jgi:hypothetical protein